MPTVIVNCSASDETIGKATYRETSDLGAVCKADRAGISMPMQEKVNRLQMLCLADIILSRKMEQFLQMATDDFANEVIYTEI